MQGQTLERQQGPDTLFDKIQYIADITIEGKTRTEHTNYEGLLTLFSEVTGGFMDEWNIRIKRVDITEEAKDRAIVYLEPKRRKPLAPVFDLIVAKDNAYKHLAPLLDVIVAKNNYTLDVRPNYHFERDSSQLSVFSRQNL